MEFFKNEPEDLPNEEKIDKPENLQNGSVSSLVNSSPLKPAKKRKKPRRVFSKRRNKKKNNPSSVIENPFSNVIKDVESIAFSDTLVLSIEKLNLTKSTYNSLELQLLFEKAGTSDTPKSRKRKGEKDSQSELPNGIVVGPSKGLSINLPGAEKLLDSVPSLDVKRKVPEKRSKPQYSRSRIKQNTAVKTLDYSTLEDTINFVATASIGNQDFDNLPIEKPLKKTAKRKTRGKLSNSEVLNKTSNPLPAVERAGEISLLHSSTSLYPKGKTSKRFCVSRDTSDLPPHVSLTFEEDVSEKHDFPQDIYEFLRTEDHPLLKLNRIDLKTNSEKNTLEFPKNTGIPIKTEIPNFEIEYAKKGPIPPLSLVSSKPYVPNSITAASKDNSLQMHLPSTPSNGNFTPVETPINTGASSIRKDHPLAVDSQALGLHVIHIEKEIEEESNCDIIEGRSKRSVIEHPFDLLQSIKKEVFEDCNREHTFENTLSSERNPDLDSAAPSENADNVSTRGMSVLLSEHDSKCSFSSATSCSISEKQQCLTNRIGEKENSPAYDSDFAECVTKYLKKIRNEIENSKPLDEGGKETDGSTVLKDNQHPEKIEEKVVEDTGYSPLLPLKDLKTDSAPEVPNEQGIYISVTDLLNILQTAKSFPPEPLQSGGEVNFMQSYDYGHGIQQKTMGMQNTSSESAVCSMGRDFYPPDPPSVQFEIVHEYGHKPPADSKSEGAGQSRYYSGKGYEGTACEEEFYTVESEIIYNSDVKAEEHDTAEVDKTVGSTKKKTEEKLTEDEVKDFPQYKSQWEIIMKRKESQNREIAPLMPLKPLSEKLIKKTVALVQPRSQTVPSPKKGFLPTPPSYRKMGEKDSKTKRLYGRVTNRGAFLTESTSVKTPKPQKVHDKRKPRLECIGDIQSMISLPIDPRTNTSKPRFFPSAFDKPSTCFKPLSPNPLDLSLSQCRSPLLSVPLTTLLPDPLFPAPSRTPLLSSLLSFGKLLPKTLTSVADQRCRREPSTSSEARGNDFYSPSRSLNPPLISPVSSGGDSSASGVLPPPPPNKHGRTRNTRCICLPPKTLKPLVGNFVFETFSVLLLILEWNVDWLVQQQKYPEPPPISNTVHKVKSEYSTFEEYYNSYLPLVLLETWQKVYVSWTRLHQAPFYFCQVTSYEVEKHSTKVKCQVIFNYFEQDKDLLPEEGTIIIVSFRTKKKDGIKILGYLTDVEVDAYNVTDSNQRALARLVKSTHADHLKLLTMTFVGAYTSDDFDTNKLVRIHVLCNIKFVLKQNDALLYAKESPLFGNILNPISEGLRTVSMVNRNSDPHKVAPSVSECVKEIMQGIVTMHPIPSLTIIKSVPSSDKLLVLPPLIEKMKDLYKMKVLYCTRTSKALADIGFLLKSCSAKVVIIGKRADVHQKLRKYMVDDLASSRVCEAHANNGIPFLEDSIKGDDVLQKARMDVLQDSDVILTLVRYCHDDLIVKLCEDGNFIARLCCIVDEANLCTEPEILIPLLYGISKLILIGDPDVPSKVCSKTAAKHHFNDSLFHRAYELDTLTVI